MTQPESKRQIRVRQGRKPDRNAKTRQAAKDALYLQGTQPLSDNAAAQQVALIWGVSADNVRKYMRKMRTPTVKVTGPEWDLGPLGKRRETITVPLIAHEATIRSPEDLERAGAEFAALLAREAGGM